MDRIGEPELVKTKMGNSISEALDKFGGYDRNATTANSAVARVFDELYRRIINLELPPDTVLTRTDLAQQYNVSQTPLREAMQKLEKDGLVKIYPQSKTVVTRIDIGQIYEAHFLRLSIETEVLRRLALDCSATVLNRLKTLLALQGTLAQNPDEILAFQEMDEVFHQTLMAGVGQAGLHSLLRERSGHLNRVRRLDMPSEGKINNILSDHREIIAALETADSDAAVKAIRHHLSQTVNRVEILREKYPNYFSD